MSLFDLIINIIESSIMCYFIYKYFDFKQMEKLWLFILAVFATITAGNYFISESWLAIVLLAGVLILFLKVFNKKMSIENIIVCLSVLIMDLVCNMITLILGSSLDFIISDPAAKLKILMIVSKTMYLLFSLYILNRKMKYNSNLDTKRWTSIIGVFLILLLELYILGNDYTINNINPTDTLFCMFLTAIVTLVIFNIYGKLLKENEESTRIRLKNEEIRYKKENEKVLSKMSEDIYQLEHNLRYILMQVKLNEQNKKYDENIELIDQYIRNFGKFKAVLAVIGNCEALEKRIAETYRERFYFLGYTEELQKTMTIGDLFLNPPRQGGGTGAMYAILQEIPVVTLDNCDVQVNVGKVFTCDSIESMVNLVHQYCEDKGFMEKKKEACRRKAEEILAVDEKENYRRLCEFVETYTIRQEKQVQHPDGR